jgi:RNA polymerase sigma factor (sigma-70 family)
MSDLRLDLDLLARFRSGERDALAEVYRRYLPRLEQLLRRGFQVRDCSVRVPGVFNPDDLADTLQEVFARAFKPEARAAYDGRRDYWPYLAVIARNMVVSRHRRSGRELLGLESASLDEENVVDCVDDPGTPWLDPRSVAIAQAYVASLPEPIRAVHAARYVQALSQRDAAKQLGLSRPKVRKLEDRMRRELRRLLEQAGLHGGGQATTIDETSETGPWTAKPRTS